MVTDQDRANAFVARLKALPKRPKITQVDADQARRRDVELDYLVRQERKQRGAKLYAGHRRVYGHAILPQTDYGREITLRRRERRLQQYQNSRRGRANDWGEEDINPGPHR